MRCKFCNEIEWDNEECDCLGKKLESEYNRILAENSSLKTSLRYWQAKAGEKQ